MIYDHAMRRVRDIVTGKLGSVPVRWANTQKEATYPCCVLQVIAGPTSGREQRHMVQPVTASVTVDAGAEGDEVSLLLGGRVLTVEHTGDAEATAALLAALAPSHWETVSLSDTWVVRGADIFGGFAYAGCTLDTDPYGDPFKATAYRRQVTVQCSIWTQLDLTGRPFRWDPTGCDTLALRVWTALRNELPDPYRVYIMPESDLRPIDEQYKDGRNYVATSFDFTVSWLDTEAVVEFGVEVGTMAGVSGDITTTDGETTAVDEWAVEA